MDLGAISGSLARPSPPAPPCWPASPVGPSFSLPPRAKTYLVSKIRHKHYTFGDTQVHQRLVGCDELVERVQGDSKRIDDITRPRWAGHCFRSRCAGTHEEARCFDPCAVEHTLAGTP